MTRGLLIDMGDDSDLMIAGMTRDLLLQLLRGAITNDGSHSVTAYVIMIAFAFGLVNGQMRFQQDGCDHNWHIGRQIRLELSRFLN